MSQVIQVNQVSQVSPPLPPPPPQPPYHPQGGLIGIYISTGYAFPTQLSLDSTITSWDLKHRIPCRKLRIQSYSQVYRPESRSKYLKIAFFT